MTSAREIVPHDLLAEDVVIGGALQFPEVVSLLPSPSHFFSDANIAIASAIARTHARGLTVDLRSVGQELQASGMMDRAGGAARLALLVDEVPTAANIAHYIQTVKDKAGLRRLIEAYTEGIERARRNGTPPGDIAADVWEKIHDLDWPAGVGPILLKLSDVLAEAVTWLWPGRLPLGKLSMVVGDPGLGKSFLTLDIASRISRGGAFPDGVPAPLGNVILLTAEDGVADTIRGRVDALDGDPSRIHVLAGVGDPEKPKSFNLADDVAHLEDAILRTRACLVVVDPLSAYLGGVDSHRDADVRGILAPLASMAERNRVAVVCVVHMNKSQQRQALYRAQGSLAFVAAARAVFGVCEDQGESGRRLLVPMKMNLAPKPPGLAFRIDSGRLAWVDGVVDVDADMAMAGAEKSEEQSDLENAKDFLRQLLGDGPAAAADIKAEANAALIAWRTVERAKGKLGVEAIHPKVPGPWFWTLPAKDAKATPSHNVGGLGGLGVSLAALQDRQPSQDRQQDRQEIEPLAVLQQTQQQLLLTTTTEEEEPKTAILEVTTRAREVGGQ